MIIEYTNDHIMEGIAPTRDICGVKRRESNMDESDNNPDLLLLRCRGGLDFFDFKT
jgi:hypothetical protein